jgi:hypothetical protein
MMSPDKNKWYDRFPSLNAGTKRNDEIQRRSPQFCCRMSTSPYGVVALDCSKIVKLTSRSKQLSSIEMKAYSIPASETDLSPTSFVIRAVVPLETLAWIITNSSIEDVAEWIVLRASHGY